MDVQVLSLDISWFDNNEPAGLAAKLEMDIAQAKPGRWAAGVSWCHGVMVSFSAKLRQFDQRLPMLPQDFGAFSVRIFFESRNSMEQWDGSSPW